jgi:ceramide glucosyltransferase
MSYAPSSSAVPLALVVTLVPALASLGYLVVCLVVAWRWRRRPQDASTAPFTPVTILKPVCGLEPNLESNLRSFCQQDFPAAVQVIIGARSADDPAIAVARRVAASLPDRDITIVTGAYTLGANQKVNTLARMYGAARHDLIVIADSDIHVGPTYLQRVVAPLADPSVGIVTCLYRGAPTASLWSRLGALAQDEWYIPSVLVAVAFGSSAFCAGATMALRRDVFDAIGAFDALAPYLADDYELGARVRQLGLQSVVSRYEPIVTVDERGFSGLVTHELRWMRTIRTVQPVGHAFLFITFALPMTLLPAPVLGRWAAVLPALAVMLRVALHYVLRDRPNPDLEPGPPQFGYDRWSLWLVPLRDVVSFVVWAASFASRRVTWRSQALRVHSDGVLSGAD